MIVDHAKVEAIISEIAQEEIVPRFGKLAKADIETKSSSNDFVTAADRAAEERLRLALAGIYPAAKFIGEEGAADNPSLLSELSAQVGAYWIVDPLDGTRNFVRGKKRFGSIVALVENGVTRAGWIYAIPDRTFASCSVGDGACWGAQRLQALGPARRETGGYRAIGNFSNHWRQKLEPPLRSKFETEAVNCAAYAYIDLALGRKNFALFSRCHPWDHAAGALLIDEIGGKAAYIDDDTQYFPAPTSGRPLLVTGAAREWGKIKRKLIS